MTTTSLSQRQPDQESALGLRCWPCCWPSARSSLRPQSPAAAAPEDAVSARIAGTDKDFNGDGDADLAVSSAQAVHIIYGSSSGLVAANTQKWTPDDIPAVPAASAAFGSELATGDFNGDGYCDLAIADDGATVDGHEDAGAVAVLYGSRGRSDRDR